MEIIKIDGGQIYEVQKYTKSIEGEESIWCNDWYGRHIIGKDCVFTDKMRQIEDIICQSCGHDGNLELHCPCCGSNFPKS